MWKFFIGLAMFAAAGIMAFLAMHHVFSANGGLLYYGTVIILGAVGPLVANIGWGEMASKC